jgi:hypothetical protein
LIGQDTSQLICGNAETGEQIRSLKSRAGVLMDVAFSRDGKGLPRPVSLAGFKSGTRIPVTNSS